MSQLIALIIAIALGAIVTAIGYVFLGDAFTKNSERGVALQLINQSTQLEMAMTAYYAENTKSAYSVDWATTKTELEDEGYLKGGMLPPLGTYTMYSESNDTFLLIDNVIATGISESVCLQVNKLSGQSPTVGSTDTDADGIYTPTAAITSAATAKTALGSARYHCFEDVDGADNATKYSYIYKVQ